jgi:hypothetical protein
MSDFLYLRLTSFPKACFKRMKLATKVVGKFISRLPLAGNKFLDYFWLSNSKDEKESVFGVSALFFNQKNAFPDISGCLKNVLY